MKPNGIITLLTDFGESDGFVGAMKGVILSINPDAKIVDISHHIVPQDVEAGAFILNNSYPFFPPGTIHVAIVDPGVGSERRILAVAANHNIFIAPDNQILKYIFYSNETLAVVEVLNKQFFLKRVSQTFHGRDIFAPVAAHLSLGLPIQNLGNIVLDYDCGAIDQPIVAGQKIFGKIIHIDKFGNLITNIAECLLKNSKISLAAGSHRIGKLSSAYDDVEIGCPVAVIGSSGFLEIAVRNGNAQQQLSINRGDRVELIFGT